MDRDGAIGKDGALPWRLPADLRHFRRITMGKPIVMGRRTHESIGRVLPGRENIVLSRDPAYQAPGCTVLRDLDAALEHCRKGGAGEVMITGGADVFREALECARRIYLTEVRTTVNGADTYFPKPDWDKWEEVERSDFAADGDNPYAYSFVILERS
jgi:dihydrofolate reductase